MAQMEGQSRQTTCPLLSQQTVNSVHSFVQANGTCICLAAPIGFLKGSQAVPSSLGVQIHSYFDIWVWFPFLRLLFSGWFEREPPKQTRTPLPVYFYFLWGPPVASCPGPSWMAVLRYEFTFIKAVEPDSPFRRPLGPRPSEREALKWKVDLMLTPD